MLLLPKIITRQKKSMFKLKKENIDKYNKIITEAADDFAYRRKRYAINYSIAIGLCDSKINLKDFILSKRQTDIVIPLEKNLYCVVFDATPMKYAIHAISNLKVKFKKEYGDEHIYISALNSKDYYNEDEMINSLFEILEYSILNDMEGLVTDTHKMGHSSALNKQLF